MKYGEELLASQMLVSLDDFLKRYNESMPASFPRATVPLLKKFKETHVMLFSTVDLWSLDKHRKKVMDWLPQNGGVVS